MAVRQRNVDHIDATLSQGAEFGIAELHLFRTLGVGSQGPIPSASLGGRSETSHFGEVEYSLCLGVHGALVGARLTQLRQDGLAARHSPIALVLGATCS